MTRSEYDKMEALYSAKLEGLYAEEYGGYGLRTVQQIAAHINEIFAARARTRAQWMEEHGRWWLFQDDRGAYIVGCSDDEDPRDDGYMGNRSTLDKVVGVYNNEREAKEAWEAIAFENAESEFAARCEIWERHLGLPV